MCDVYRELGSQPAPHETSFGILIEAPNLELMPLDLRDPTLARRVVVEVLRDVAKRCEGWNLIIELDEVGEHPVLQANDPCAETARGQR